MSYRGKKSRAVSIADHLRERIIALPADSLFTGELVLAESFDVKGCPSECGSPYPLGFRQE